MAVLNIKVYRRIDTVLKFKSIIQYLSAYVVYLTHTSDLYLLIVLSICMLFTTGETLLHLFNNP